MELAAPLDGLGDGTGGCYFAKRSVGIGGVDVAVGAKHFAHVLGEVEAVGAPGAVLLDGQRARGYRLRGVPQQQPHHRMMTAGEVDAGNLQITAVNIALVEHDLATGNHLLVTAAAHVVVAAMHRREVTLSILRGEVGGAVLVVVGDGPAAGACLHAGLIAVGIKLRQEETFIILHNAGVLVERIRRVDGCFLSLHGKFSIADVIIRIAVGNAVHAGAAQLGAGVVGEDIVHHSTLAGCIASGRAAKGIVAVLALHHQGAAAVVGYEK